MKKIVIIFLSIVSFFTSDAKDKLAVIIRPALDNSKISKVDPTTLQQVPQITDPSENMKMNNPIMKKNSIYIIRFRDIDSKALLQIGQVDPTMLVTVSINGKNYPRPLNNSETNMTDLNIDIKTLLNGDDIPDNSDVSISVKITNNSFDIFNSTFDTKFYNSKQHYQSLGTDLGGFWIPTLLYSSNFKSTNDGVAFASLPIGIAYGWKFIGKKGGYIGVSGMLNWFIYSQGSSSSSSIGTSSSFNLQGGTAGLLLDFSDIISLGYAYGKNFQSGGKDPGNMFVLGIGSKTLGFFKKNKTSVPADPKTLSTEMMLQ